MSHRTTLNMPLGTMRSALPHVGFITVMVFLSMYARLIMSPLLIYLQQDLAIGPARATRLFLTVSIAYSVTIIASGFLAEKIIHRRTIALSATLLGTGLLIAAVAPNLPVMHLAFAVIGSGAGLYPPAGVTALTALVSDDIRGRAIALHETGPNLAFVLAPLMVSAGVLFLPWRWIPAISGVAALAAAFFFERYSVAGGFTGERLRFNNVASLIRKGEFWAILVLFSLAASSTMGVFAILPTYLVTTRGYDAPLVNTLISLSRISGVAMLFLSGFLIDRIGVRPLVTIILAVTGVLTIGIGALNGNAMLAAVFLQPVIITAFFPAAVSVMADLGPPRIRNVAISVIVPAVNIVAAGLFPALMGYLTEMGGVEGGFIGLGACILGGIAMVPLLKR